MADNLPANERTAESTTHDKPRSNGALWGGIALLIAGVYFLLNNMGIDLDFGYLDFNWWAFFMLIPAAAILKRVYDGYEANGQQMTRHLRNQLVIGVIIGVVALAFLVDINMTILWPLLLIIGGAAVLYQAVERGQS